MKFNIGSKTPSPPAAAVQQKAPDKQNGGSGWVSPLTTVAVVGSVGSWGMGTLILRGANSNGAQPWAKLPLRPSRQAVCQYLAFWALFHAAPLALVVGTHRNPEFSYTRNVGTRLAVAGSVAGTGYIMYQTLGALRALRRVEFPKGPFYAGRLPTLAAGAFVTFYAGATLLALQMAYSPPPAVKTDEIEKLSEME